MVHAIYLNINFFKLLLLACFFICLATNKLAYFITSTHDNIEYHDSDEPVKANTIPKSFDPTDPNTIVTIISAHHDDEVIWFEPWLDIADIIITPTVYPTSAYMKNNIALKYMSLTNWIPLQGETDHNTAKHIAHDRDYRQQHITNIYLSDLLDRHVISSDVIISHSPWGEYGHEQHRQIYCILQNLVIKYKKDLYIWNGSPDVHNPSHGYPITYFLLERNGSELSNITLPFDRRKYDDIRNIFIQAESIYPKSPDEKLWNYQFWTWDRPYESGGAKLYNPPQIAKYYKIFENGNPLYDFSQMQETMNKVRAFPDDRANESCLLNPLQTE